MDHPEIRGLWKGVSEFRPGGFRNKYETVHPAVSFVHQPLPVGWTAKVLLVIGIGLDGAVDPGNPPLQLPDEKKKFGIVGILEANPQVVCFPDFLTDHEAVHQGKSPSAVQIGQQPVDSGMAEKPEDFYFAGDLVPVDPGIGDQQQGQVEPRGIEPLQEINQNPLGSPSPE